MRSGKSKNNENLNLTKIGSEKLSSGSKQKPEPNAKPQKCYIWQTETEPIGRGGRGSARTRRRGGGAMMRWVGGVGGGGAAAPGE